ncbi:MAG TPA: glycosyltransferase family 4 protein [Blastocatellia bacterium]|nr:glycosyltransferase family 4 protein [Blastocatellia bacterium]
MEPSHKGYQVIAPKSTNKPEAPNVRSNALRRERDIARLSESNAVTVRATEGVNRKQPLALLLDMSGDKRVAMQWAVAALPAAEVRPINKADLKWESKRGALARVRSLKPDMFAVFASDLSRQSARSAMIVFAALSGARRVVMGDRSGRALERSRTGALLVEAPRLALELLIGYGWLVPLSWLLTELVALSLRFRGVARASRTGRAKLGSDEKPSRAVLYVRATPSSMPEGGMHTHTSGLASGAAALGHRLTMLVCSAAGLQLAPHHCVSIKPSAFFTATKALFELWNNIVFTIKSLQLVTRSSPDDADFIYQRYSRFNWTGVALSLVTGLPLALEFNASEIWVSRNWDPIGQLWLLKRFEKLNLRAADLIFVVSEVERRNLTRAGISSERIVVNPNGVDTDMFRPGCGGDAVRRALGVESRTVVGFVGTFGPWHGAPVLAEAARRVSGASRCHFLFVGEGEQRSEAEAIIEAADSAVSATFTGRIPHASIPSYLDACDMLVSPHVESTDGSEFFGSPTKLFEYMATGKAIVASRLGQIGEVIVDGENGLLVEPGDARSLAKAIERLSQDAAVRARLGSAARRTVLDRYTWKHNAARVFEAIRTVNTEIER